MSVTLVDIAGGNLHSAVKALESLGAAVSVTRDPAQVRGATRLVMPGDGAFPAVRAALDAAPGLEDALAEAVLARGVPILGICVGMQLLADRGHEYRETPGLRWIGGEIEAIRPADPALRVPHMGWNDLRDLSPHPLLAGVAEGDHVYFVHSWQFRAADPAHVLARVDHGGPVTAMVARDNIAGVQFHPEKSAATGLTILRNFLGWRP